MERAKPPPDISPDEFFTRWLGQAVASDPERRRRLGGTRATVVFELQGDAHDGAGRVFTLEIDEGVVRGRAGQAEESQLRVRVDVDTWRRLNAGEIKAPQALLTRRLRLEGDFLLGLKLHLILG